ncbi:MAG: GTPase, partial [SAR202 cluster bacterium]|nr:GTPase [SAR202 cluster bacterium]
MDKPARVIIMGAAGRDFHNFNTVFRDRPDYEVVAFTAAQIPGIARRTYPASLAGKLYPKGIPIHDEADLENLVRDLRAGWVYFSYSDVSHMDVMHIASRALSAGASFGFLGPDATMLPSRLPVVAVCAVRTGAGKSPLSQWVARRLNERGHRVAVLRHPMPYGDLGKQAVQRFAGMADLDRYEATIEEREEYEPYIRMGIPVYAGVDYARILALAEDDADVVLWDGGNNDFPFLKPDLHLVVVDPLRVGHELAYHPGEVNFRMADAFVISKVGSASKKQLDQVRANIESVRPGVPVALADLALTLEPEGLIEGKKVVIVGDGPTLTHGGMGYGAGSLAARANKAAAIVDARPYAVGELQQTFEAFPHLKDEIPAMGYSPHQVSDLQRTLERVPADVVLDATPVDLSRLVRLSKPVVNVEYRFAERGDVLEHLLEGF